MNLFFSLILIFFSTFVDAQIKDTYLKDISFLRSVLEKTPSFKDQIKGQKLVEYNILFQKLKDDTPNSILSYKYFSNLAKLFLPITDNHLGFYQTIDEDNFTDKSSYEKYIQTQEFKDFPKYDIDTDSLENILSKKHLDSIEGIYYLDTLFTVGLFKSKTNEYIGVVLSSKIRVYGNSIWEKGQIAFYLYENSPNYFKAIYVDPILKIFILYPNEKFIHSSFINSYFSNHFKNINYSKIPNNKTEYINLPKNISDFSFKNLNSQIQYLHIKHFSASNLNIQKSNLFYDTIKNKLNAANLILDLRNNEGGAEKVSKKFLKLIKNFVKKGKVYVLVNNGTVSQGEIFTLQLKQLANVHVFGQTTRGNLMYGNNYGKRETLPSKRFEVYITDMKGNKNYAPYETFGIEPDGFLSNNTDWVEQIINKIENE